MDPVDVGVRDVRDDRVDDVRVDLDEALVAVGLRVVCVAVGLRVVGVDDALVLHCSPFSFAVSLHLLFFRSVPFCLPLSNHFAPFLSLTFVFQNIPCWIFWSSKACKNHCKRDNG